MTTEPNATTTITKTPDVTKETSDASDEEEALDTVATILRRSNHKNPSVRKFAEHLSFVSRQYDLDGDGILNAAERAMRDMDKGDGSGLNKHAVYDTIQELMTTQKSLLNTKRLLFGITFFAVLMMCSIFGLTFAVAKLTDDTDIQGGSGESGAAELVSTEDSNVVIATIGEGFTVHHQELDQDPYGLASSAGSLFFPDGMYSTETDSYKCTLEDYLTNAKLLGQVEGCRGVYTAAERAQTISILSADEKHLLPGQSLVSVILQPQEVWIDPIVQPNFSFYKDTAHLIKGTTNGSDCRLFVFMEDIGKDACPYYEIPNCVVPDCITNPPEYNPGNDNPNDGRPYPAP